MKKYSNHINESEDFDLEYASKYLTDKGCKVEGETADGKQIWSCENDNTVSNYKLEKDGEMQLVFNKVHFYKIVGDQLKDLHSCPRVTNTYEISINDSLTNLEGFAEICKHADISMCPNLTSLKGLPKRIEGDISISFCEQLTSLEGLPEYVGGSITLEGLPITNLQHFPKHVGSKITFKGNKLTSLEGVIKHVNKDFTCQNETELKTLVGGPDYVKGELRLMDTDNLTSYNGFPKFGVGDLRGSDGPSEIEGEFILNFDYVNNRGYYGGAVWNRALSDSPIKKNDKDLRYGNYFEDLLKYILEEEQDKTRIADVNWPKSFIEKQDGEVKNLMGSSRGIKKFNIT